MLGRHCADTNARYDRQVGCDVLSSTDVLGAAAAAATRARQEQSSAGFHFYSARFGWVNAPLRRPARSKRGLAGSELCAGDGAERNIAVHNNVNCERATRR